MPRVWSKRKGAERPPADAVLVDRTTEWGNPFEMARESQRDLVCSMFEDYAEALLEIDPDWLEPLRGKDLVCWCAPKRCHADTLLKLANAERAD